MQRRTFLKLTSTLSLLGLNPSHLLAATALQPSLPRSHRILLLVELNGGNDSLNTTIPLQQLERYQQLRPQLALDQDERFALDDQYALHKALNPLQPIWQAGEMALIHGLGYPAPNRSHFRSIEIWDTASASDQYLNEGWLAHIHASIDSAPTDAIVLGRNAAAVMGGKTRYLKLQSLTQFINNSKRVQPATSTTSALPALNFVMGLQNQLYDGATTLVPQLLESQPLKARFPQSVFGQALKDTAKLIRLNLGIPAYKVALGSFDTHRNQLPMQARLLGELAQGLAAFRQDMLAAGQWQNIAVMTYSEFGRRAAQNGSGGTDHGTAATHFMLGGGIKGGHIGEHPDLQQLVNQDMVYTTDFRRLYQTVLTDWMGQPGLPAAAGNWERLPLFREPTLKRVPT